MPLTTRNQAAATCPRPTSPPPPPTSRPSTPTCRHIQDTRRPPRPSDRSTSTTPSTTKMPGLFLVTHLLPRITK